MAQIEQDAADEFIAKWDGIKASELSTSQTFLIDLCHLLGVEAPHADAEQTTCSSARSPSVMATAAAAPGASICTGAARLSSNPRSSRPPCSTRGFDDAMLRARSQAEAYARALPAAEGRPPFLVVVDVGHAHRTVFRVHPLRRHLHAVSPIRAAIASPGGSARAAIRERLRQVWIDRCRSTLREVRPRHPRDRRAPGRPGACRWKQPATRRTRRALPHALPVHHVCRRCAVCCHARSFRNLLIQALR